MNKANPTAKPTLENLDSEMSASPQHIILISAPDKKGLVYHISSVLFELSLNIERNDEYVIEKISSFLCEPMCVARWIAACFAPS